MLAKTIRESCWVFAVFVISCFALTGCSPQEGKLDGSIFVVTRGAENIKLALVTVDLLSEQHVRTNLTRLALNLENTLLEQKQEVMALQKAYDQAFSETKELEQKSENAKLQLDLFSSRIPEIWSDRDEEKLGNLRNLSAKWENVRAELQEMEAKKVRTQQLWDERFPAEKRSEAERLKNEVARLQLEWNMAKSEWVRADQKTKSADTLLSSATKAYEHLSTTSLSQYFYELPTPLHSTKSDADGKFSMPIARHGQFVLAATASRMVLDRREDYYWLVKVDLDGKQAVQVMLSNDNLATAWQIKYMFITSK